MAQHKAARLIVRHEKGEYDPWRPTGQPKTQALGAAATAFLQTRRNLSKQAVAKYRSVLGQLVRHAGRKTALNLLTPAKVQAFIDASDRRAITSAPMARRSPRSSREQLQWMSEEGSPT